MKRFLIGVLAASLAVSCFAANVSPEEQGRQDEFKKAYNNPDKNERIKALGLLDGFSHPSTMRLLATVFSADRDKDVKKEAVLALAKAPARDLSVSRTLASIFNGIKPSDVDERLEYAQIIAQSQFKYPITEILAGWGSRMRFPDRFTGHRQAGQIDPNIAIDKQRGQFEKFLEAFNALTGANLKAGGRNAPAEVREWWARNAGKVAAADKVLLDKFKAEDEAWRDKHNPLVSKKPADEKK